MHSMTKYTTAKLGSSLLIYYLPIYPGGPMMIKMRDLNYKRVYNYMILQTKTQIKTILISKIKGQL